MYTDYTYRRVDGNIYYAERAFALFLVALAEYLDRLVIVGEVDPGSWTLSLSVAITDRVRRAALLRRADAPVSSQHGDGALAVDLLALAR